MRKKKQLPLRDWHIKNAAVMTTFVDLEVPLWYSTGAEEESRTVREKAGLFDVSHTGIIEVIGLHAEPFLQFVTTNNVSRLSSGNVQYSFVCNNNGGIMDDVLIYKVSDRYFLLTTNPRNFKKIYAWLDSVKKMCSFNTKIIAPEDWVVFSLQGPLSREILLHQFPYLPDKKYSFDIHVLNNSPAMVLRTTYMGEDGYEIICSCCAGERIWEKIISNGAAPCGMVARDILRMEAGARVYGRDINEATSPIDAEMEKFIFFGKNFFGKKVLLEAFTLKQKGEGSFFCGFVLDNTTERNPLLKHGCEIIESDGFGVTGGVEQVSGKVTSVQYSPTLKKTILTGYVSMEKKENDVIWVKIRENYFILARVVSLPFYSLKE
jgi:aminomethyltransferase